MRWPCADPGGDLAWEVFEDCDPYSASRTFEPDRDRGDELLERFPSPEDWLDYCESRVAFTYSVIHDIVTLPLTEERSLL